MAITWGAIKSHSTITLVPDTLLVLQAVGQVRGIGEHPRLPSGRLAWRGCTECPVPAGSGCCASELSGEVDGEGAETLILVEIRVPAGLLLDKGVWSQGRVGSPWGEVQNWCPLPTAADWHVTATVPGERGDGGQQGIHVPHIRPHLDTAGTDVGLQVDKRSLLG